MRSPTWPSDRSFGGRGIFIPIRHPAEDGRPSRGGRPLGRWLLTVQRQRGGRGLTSSPPRAPSRARAFEAWELRTAFAPNVSGIVRDLGVLAVRPVEVSTPDLQRPTSGTFSRVGVSLNTLRRRGRDGPLQGHQLRPREPRPRQARRREPRRDHDAPVEGGLLTVARCVGRGLSSWASPRHHHLNGSSCPPWSSGSIFGAGSPGARTSAGAAPKTARRTARSMRRPRLRIVWA